MNDKTERHGVIREIVTARAVASQAELRKHLRKRGRDVTQSTLSRDLRELRLARIPDGKGRARYAFPEGQSGSGKDETRQLEAMLPQLLRGVEGVQLLAVARTRKSGAQPVAEALDQLVWPDIAGTIAGDDTVLIICRSLAGCGRVVKRLKAYLHE